MIKITTKEKDNIQPRNVAIILGKYSVICISRNNRKNILHITNRSSIQSVVLKQKTTAGKAH
jgi:hypothetical protein